jgi:phage terminase small subunit
MPEKARKTDARWKLFAHEYVIDLNGSRAAIAAGYSERRAAVTGSELVRKRKVARLIEALMSKRASKLELKAESIVEELCRLAFSNMLDYMIFKR